MTDENKHIEFIELTVKYLSGQAGESDVKRLEDWVLASPDHKRTFNEIKQAWMLSGIESNTLGIDVEREWKAVSDELFQTPKVVQMPPRREVGFYLGIAATLIVLVAASIWFFMPGRSAQVWSTQNQVAVNSLPDGSQVSLNQYASVVVEPKFDKKERRLKLKGDAFFQVERNPEKPFIVEAEEVEVKVLGTAFYVDSREGQPNIEVIVQSGTVSVTAQDQSIILNAGETGVYERASRQLIKQTNEDENFLAWKTNTLVFDNEKLDIVVHALNRKFHAQIEMNISDVSNCFITATFENKSLEAIIKIIEKTLVVTARREGEKIILAGESCL